MPLIFLLLKSSSNHTDTRLGFGLYKPDLFQTSTRLNSDLGLTDRLARQDQSMNQLLVSVWTEVGLKTHKIFFALGLSTYLMSCSDIKAVDDAFPSVSAACAQKASQNRFIVQWENGEYTIEKGRSADDFRTTFVADNLNEIKHVDQDQYMENLQPEVTIESESNDISEQSTQYDRGPLSIGAQDMWSRGFEGSGVVVGVVDGMVDSSHSQLANQILVNTGEIPNNGVDDDGNGFVDDYQGVKVNSGTNDPLKNRHGTHVTGIVVADSTKGLAVGMAPKAKVIPAQFIGNTGGGSIGDAIIALNYVANRGAKIINMSWSMKPCADVPNLRSTLAGLSNKGILLITAAGNGDENGRAVNMDSTPAFPSAYNFSNQINIAASDSLQNLASFSNYGLQTVHMAAPGVSIWSTTPQNSREPMTGTSMSAPMVAGAAALLMSALPKATAAQIKQALMSSVTLPPVPFNIKAGGIINVYSAYNKLKTIVQN